MKQQADTMKELLETNKKQSDVLAKVCSGTDVLKNPALKGVFLEFCAFNVI